VGEEEQDDGRLKGTCDHFGGEGRKDEGRPAPELREGWGCDQGLSCIRCCVFLVEGKNYRKIDFVGAGSKMDGRLFSGAAHRGGSEVGLL